MQSGRLELRISKEKKSFFEEMASLAGFKSLSEFMLQSAQLQADKIAKERMEILSSEQDQIQFFEAIVNPSEANDYLKKAAQRYKAIADK